MHYVMPILVVFAIVTVIGACWQKSSSVKRMLPKAKQFLKDHFDELSLSDGLADLKTLRQGLAKFPQNYAEIKFLRENISGIGHVYKKDASASAKAAATISVAASAPDLAGLSATAGVASDSTVYVISREDLDAEHAVDFLGTVTKKSKKK
jgi:hypothetical protein